MSGSRDRTIKIWNLQSLTAGAGSKGLVQTLFGHIGGVSGIADGDGGVIVSCSVDGTVRVWSPQRGRDMMLNPFYECTFQLQASKTAWLTALAINTRGHWSVYVGDSNGTIEIYRKGIAASNSNSNSNSKSDKSTHNSPRLENTANSIEAQIASYSGQLTSFRRWDSIHRLGVSDLKLMIDDGLMITLSFDCSCKISDLTLGHTFYALSNPQRCMYTGCVYLKSRSWYLLTDELGNVEVFSPQMEKTVHRSQVLKCKTPKQMDDILSSHKDPLITSVFASSVADQIIIIEPTSKLCRGEISFWQLINDTTCVEFTGHDGLVIDIGVLPINDGNSRWESTRNPSYLNSSRYDEKKLDDAIAAVTIGNSHSNSHSNIHSNSHSMSRGSKSTASLISRDEFLFFSAADDQTIRCWDQFDYKESYNIKSKSPSPVSAMTMIWGMNMIATGHENGLLCIWHADAGTRVASHALKSSVTCILEAKNINSDILVGSDYSGMIAVWNLTLLAANPTVLCVDTTFRGFHDIEDSSILSLCWHQESRSLFSGGIDRLIKHWHLGNEIANSIDSSHSEGVCCLACTGDFLLSGDEECHFYLWQIITSSTSSSSSSSSTPSFAVLCHWPPTATSPGRGIGCISQVDKGSVSIVIADSLNKTTVWQLTVQDNSAWADISHTNGYSVVGLGSSNGNSIGNSDNNGARKTTVDVKRERENGKEDSGDSYDPLLGLQIYHSRYPDLTMTAKQVVELNHSENEVSCIRVCCSPSLSLRFVYLGTLEGTVLRYEILHD